MTERPLFIDPITVGTGDDVDDEPAPRWFALVALLILAAAAFYAVSFWGGPADEAPNRFQPGLEVYERVTAPEGGGATPAPAH
ncbi:MAG TPA: hypothetical protein VNA20_11955 [Frankiaceae bacterium]|nr:hypothetical protein [Frankiaceae bacterium]